MRPGGAAKDDPPAVRHLDDEVAIGVEAGPDGVEESREVVERNVLDHVDGRDHVEPFAREADLREESAPHAESGILLEPPARVGRLDARDVEAAAACRPQHPAISTADVEQPFARLQPELAADVVELVDLRLVDAVGEILEVAAAVDHALVKEEPVEGIRDVVMMLDRLLVGPADIRVASGKIAARRHLFPRKQDRWQVAQDRQLGQ